MVDLETRGTIAGCSIISLGIIKFDPFAAVVDRVFDDDGYHAVVFRESCLDALLHEDPGTLQWWSEQPEAARKVLALSEDSSTSLMLKEALEQTVAYVAGHTTPSKALVWGNGADFDNPILNVAARGVGMELPWKWGNRCYRTIKNLHEILGSAHRAPPVTRIGTYHNALDDARTQAVHMWDILHRLRHDVRPFGGGQSG